MNFIRYQNYKIQKSPVYKSGNVYQKDFLLFIDLLNNTHPLFASCETSPIDLDYIRKNGYEWAKNCESDTALKIYLENIISQLNDGHTTLLYDFKNPSLYPFTYYEINGDYYLYAISEEKQNFLGKKIISINENPVNEVINSFRNMFSCDNNEGFKIKIQKEIANYDIWKNSDYCRNDSAILLNFSDGSNLFLYPKDKKSIKIKTLKTGHSDWSVREKTKEPFIYKLFTKEKICYLQFRTCQDKTTVYVQLKRNNQNYTKEQIDKILARFPRFDTFLDKMFDDMNKHEIETLVIDVRGNSGGNSLLCKVLQSRLKYYDEIKPFTTRLRISDLWKESYPAFSSRLENACKEKGEKLVSGKMYDNRELMEILDIKPVVKEEPKNQIDALRINDDPEKIFSGNVIFIQDERTYSSAGLLITEAIDNNIGIVIGTKSSYNPCHYGELLAWSLPNTGIKGCISCKHFFRPNAELCSENYIAPIENLSTTWEDVLMGKDIYWEWVLSKYGK